MSNSELNYSGQYVIDNLDWIQPNGLAINILEHYEQITIYEDIFSPFMSGNILMRDTLDIPNLFMNSGVDVIRIRAYTPGIPEQFVIDKLFHIYKIDEREEVSDRTLAYIIHFVSAENIVDQASKISKTLKGTAEELTQKFVTEYLQSSQKVNTDPSANIMQYTSNYWIPSRNLNYVSERAIGKENLPTFLFYENRSGFNLTDLSKFSDKNYPILQTWNASDYVSDISTSGQVIRDPKKDYESVQEVTMKTNFDYMKDSKQGLIKTRLFSYDFITRQFKDRTASVLDRETPLMNAQRFYRDTVVDAAGETHMTGFAHYSLYNGSGNASNAVDWLHKRNVIMRALQQHKLEIVVYGRTDYTVGKKARFDGNKMRAFTNDSNQESVIDNLLSGNYIISAVRHRFKRDNFHECKIEMIKDSVQKQT
jgi:hypothetical protein